MTETLLLFGHPSSVNHSVPDKGHWGRWTLRWMWTLASLSFFSSLIQPSAEGSLSSLPPPTYVPAQGFKVFYWKNGHRRWENMRPCTDLSWNRTQNLCHCFHSTFFYFIQTQICVHYEYLCLVSPATLHCTCTEPCYISTAKQLQLALSYGINMGMSFFTEMYF